MASNPQIPANKGKRYPAEPLTAEEVRSLMAACSRRAPTGIRNRALITVLCRGGLRISEALALEPKDLDRKEGAIRVLHGKGDKSRTVGLDPEAFAFVELWLECRRGLGINGRRRVFCTLAGSPLSTAYVRALLPRLARKAGIEKRVHAHGLRHTHAAELAREGVRMNVIQAQLGHSSLATTDRYIRHIEPQEVIETMRARKWEL
jgi:site-specific recombinase XerD